VLGSVDNRQKIGFARYNLGEREKVVRTPSHFAQLWGMPRRFTPHQSLFSSYLDVVARKWLALLVDWERRWAEGSFNFTSGSHTKRRLQHILFESEALSNQN